MMGAMTIQKTEDKGSDLAIKKSPFLLVKGKPLGQGGQNNGTAGRENDLKPDQGNDCWNIRKIHS